MRLLRRKRPGSSPDPLGSGLWRRTYGDCATAARRAVPVLDSGSAGRVDAALAATLTAARAAGDRWPTDGLDVPAEPAARAAYDRLRRVDRAFRDVAYRVSLLAGGADGQGPLLARALDDLEAAVAELGEPPPG